MQHTYSGILWMHCNYNNSPYISQLLLFETTTSQIVVLCMNFRRPGKEVIIYYIVRIYTEVIVFQVLQK